MTQRARSGRALLWALAGFVALSVGDAIVKSIAGTIPGSAISAIRHLIGAAGLAAAVALVHGRAGFVCPRPWLQAARGAGAALSTFCFFMALHAMSLADATAIAFTSPILTAMLSAVLLGERLPKRTWLAILLAFAGVLVVLRPEISRLGLAALWPLGAALGFAGLIIANRAAAGLAPVLTMQMLTGAFAAPMLLVAAVVAHLTGGAQFHVATLPAAAVLRIAAVAVSGSLAHMLIYVATTRVTAGVVAPMSYVQLIVASGLGWLMFGDAPDAATGIGATMIAGAGIILWRSQASAGVAETPD